MMHTQGWETQKAPTCLYVLNYMSSADTERSLDADPPPILSTTSLTYIINPSCSHLQNNDLITPSTLHPSMRQHPIFLLSNTFIADLENSSRCSFFTSSRRVMCCRNSCYRVQVRVLSLQGRSTVSHHIAVS